jgi:coenzyme PQQ precursor peptide PqqA
MACWLALRCVRRPSSFDIGRDKSLIGTFWEKRMSWKTPKIVEVSVGMEINMYACASRK